MSIATSSRMIDNSAGLSMYILLYIRLYVSIFVTVYAFRQSIFLSLIAIACRLHACAALSHWMTSHTIWALLIGQAPRFGHLKYPCHFLFNSHQAWYMISNTPYNYDWHVISVQNMIFHELKKSCLSQLPSMPQRNLILASF